MEELYRRLGLPLAGHVGARVPKQTFYEQAEFGAAERRLFMEHVEQVTWQYTIKPENTRIQAFVDGLQEYKEIVVLQVQLKSPKQVRRVAELVHRSIPYPLLLLLVDPARAEPDPWRLAFSVAPKRVSQTDRAAMVVEEVLLTEWMELTEPTTIQRAFLDSLALRNLPQRHLLALYMSLVDRFVALECAAVTESYQVRSGSEERQGRREQLAAVHTLMKEIGACRATLKKEPQFNRQVELSMRIKRLEAQLQQLRSGL